MDRRQFLKTSGLSLAVAGIGARSVRSARAQTAPIKVGVLAPLTGVVASGGREMVEGTQFWFDQVGSEIAGRKVELMIEDDGSNPDTALQKARKLVEQANVSFPDRQSARQYWPRGRQLCQGAPARPISFRSLPPTISPSGSASRMWSASPAIRRARSPIRSATGR